MILTGHLIGIIAMAIMTIIVLTIGTLAAAGMLGRRPESDTGRAVGDPEHDDGDARRARARGHDAHVEVP